MLNWSNVQEDQKKTFSEYLFQTTPIKNSNDFNGHRSRSHTSYDYESVSNYKENLYNSNKKSRKQPMEFDLNNINPFKNQNQTQYASRSYMSYNSSNDNSMDYVVSTHNE